MQWREMIKPQMAVHSRFGKIDSGSYRYSACKRHLQSEGVWLVKSELNRLTSWPECGTAIRTAYRRTTEALWCTVLNSMESYSHGEGIMSHNSLHVPMHHCSNATVILIILFVIWVARYRYWHTMILCMHPLRQDITRYWHNWSCYKGWEIYLGHRYFMSNVVHMTRIIVRALLLLLHIALILCLSKLPALVAFSCSCSYSMCTVLPIAGCHNGLF